MRPGTRQRGLRVSVPYPSSYLGRIAPGNPLLAILVTSEQNIPALPQHDGRDPIHRGLDLGGAWQPGR